jgi:hypothetical protein
MLIEGSNSSFADIGLQQLLFAVLVSKLGGEVLITQEDIDAVAFNFLEEYHPEEGYLYKIVKRGIRA